MKSIFIFIGAILCSVYVCGQVKSKWSLRVGAGYFGDVGAKMFGANGDFEGYNPRYYETHHGSSVFFEVSYLMENNYSVGVKLFKAETKLPYNSIYFKNLLYNANSINSINGLEINILYNLKYKKHRLGIGVGSVLCINNQSFFDGTIVENLSDEIGSDYGLLVLNDNMILERSEMELGFNPNINYEFMLTTSIGVGFKTEASFLAYYGLTYVTFYPIIVFHI